MREEIKEKRKVDKCLDEVKQMEERQLTYQILWDLEILRYEKNAFFFFLKE